MSDDKKSGTAVLDENIGQNFKTPQPKNAEHDLLTHQLAEKAGERIRKLALTIKANPELRREIEELAHDLESSVPPLSISSRPIIEKLGLGSFTRRLSTSFGFQSSREDIDDEEDFDDEDEFDDDDGQDDSDEDLGGEDGSTNGRPALGNNRSESGQSSAANAQNDDKKNNPKSRSSLKKNAERLNKLRNKMRGNNPMNNGSQKPKGDGIGKKTGKKIAKKSAKLAAQAGKAAGQAVSKALVSPPGLIAMAVVLAVLIIAFLLYIIFAAEEERLRQEREKQCQGVAETMTIAITGPEDATAGQVITYSVSIVDTVPNQEVTVAVTIPEGVSTVETDIVSSWTNRTITGNIITWKASENLPPNSLSPPNFNFTVAFKATAPSVNAVLVIEATPSRAGGATGGGSTIVLDPGHGGSESVVTDPVSGLIDRESANTPEREEVFDVAQKVKADLEATGYKVVMTKDSVQQTTSHRARSDVANNANAALAVSFHNDHGQPYSWSEIYTQKVGLFRAAGDKRLAFTDAAIAAKSLEYATIIAQERALAEGRAVPLRDANFDARQGYSSGNIPLVMLFAKVPWVYNEIGAAPVGQRVPQDQLDKYAAGITAGIKKAVPIAGGAPAPGGAGCVPGGAGGPANENYVAPAPADSCGGKYATYVARNTFLPQNYGDPQCNFSKDELRNLLMKLENNNEKFVNFWFVTIIPHESGFQPNAWAKPVGAQARLDAGGAWGLYQKGSSTPPGSPPPAPGKNGPLDRGDVNWEVQTSNAISANREAGCDFWYYGTYRRAVGERVKQC